MQLWVRIPFLCLLVVQLSASGLPIWELLGKQEKIGQLLYHFMHMVGLYCRNSSIPDCAKVLTLYGTSNLINQDEHILDTLDPSQRNAGELIWNKSTNDEFTLPPNLKSPLSLAPLYDNHGEDFNDIHSIDNYEGGFSDFSDYPASSFNDPHPYAVRVPAPTNKVSSGQRKTEENHLRNREFDKATRSQSSTKSKTSLIRRGKQYRDQEEYVYQTLPLVSSPPGMGSFYVPSNFVASRRSPTMLSSSGRIGLSDRLRSKPDKVSVIDDSFLLRLLKR